MNRIMIVEDDVALASGIGEFLSDQGFETEICSRGDRAIDRIRDFQPQLIVLDLMLPGLPGLEVLSRIRQWSPKAVVILLTARSEIHDKISGFNLGADDYMTKPFDLMELLLRIRSWLKRMESGEGTVVSRASSNPEGEPLCLGNLRLERLSRRVLAGNCEIQLTRSEYSLLEDLLLNRGIVRERAALIERLWGDNPDSDSGTRSVDVHLGNLRRKFEGAGVRGLRLRTLRGVGYVLEAEESEDGTAK